MQRKRNIFKAYKLMGIRKIIAGGLLELCDKTPIVSFEMPKFKLMTADKGPIIDI